MVANQLLTDFGRTASLEQSAKLRTASQNQNVTNTRAQVLVDVQQAYYRALASESILRVARATLDLRRVTLRQVSALAQSALRSTVDVSFAQVNVSQAELDLFRAENDATASHARLSAAMGYDRDQPFSLTDEPLPSPLDPNVDGLIEQANARAAGPGCIATQSRRAGSLCGSREGGCEIRQSAPPPSPGWLPFAMTGCPKPTVPRVST